MTVLTEKARVVEALGAAVCHWCGNVVEVTVDVTVIGVDVEEQQICFDCAEWSGDLVPAEVE